MTLSEPNIKILVDPTNPGQFFACCGLLELADRLWPGAELAGEALPVAEALVDDQPNRIRTGHLLLTF